MTTRLTTIFSTGDAGAARGALDAAVELNLKIGGHTASDLPAPYAEHLRRTLAPRMAARLNVQDSDGTLIVSFSTSLPAGSPAAYADEAVGQQRKASLHIVLPRGSHPEQVRREALAFVAEEKIATLHVTGPRESEEPGIQQAVHDALVWIFEDEVQPHTTFEGVDRTAAPESLAGVALAAAPSNLCTCGHDRNDHDMWGTSMCTSCGCQIFIPAKPSVVDTIARIAAELPDRPEHPPLTTEDALRQVAATGSEDARLLALAELAHRAEPPRCTCPPSDVPTTEHLDGCPVSAYYDIPTGAVVMQPVGPTIPGTMFKTEKWLQSHVTVARASVIKPADIEPLHPPEERGRSYHNYFPPAVWAAAESARKLAEADAVITSAGRVGLVQQLESEGQITQEQARALLEAPQVEPAETERSPHPGEFDDCDCPSHKDQDGNITRRPADEA